MQSFKLVTEFLRLVLNNDIPEIICTNTDNNNTVSAKTFR